MLHGHKERLYGTDKAFLVLTSYSIIKYRKSQQPQSRIFKEKNIRRCFDGNPNPDARLLEVEPSLSTFPLKI